jgi:hypothetical protein
MISHSGVCGLNFTKRSSFSTRGLRRLGFVQQGQPRIARSFNCGETPPQKPSPGGAADKIVAGNSVAPPGLVGFIPSNPQLKLRAIFVRRSATFPIALSKPWDQSHGYHRGSLRDFAALQCYLPISSRSAKILQERGQPCPRVSSPTLAARGQGCPRSFGCGLSRAARLR